MLKIKAIMNSGVEDVFNFKTCCGIRAFDQNLEIRLTNETGRDIVVPSCFELEGGKGTRKIDTLMPHGHRPIAAGETIAFYCAMDPETWQAASRMTFYDTAGNRYSSKIECGESG